MKIAIKLMIRIMGFVARLQETERFLFAYYIALLLIVLNCTLFSHIRFEYRPIDDFELSSFNLNLSIL